MKNNVIIFMPSIDGGGVEKNLFLVSNFLSKKVKSLKVITISKQFKKKFDKSVQLITLKNNIWNKLLEDLSTFYQLSY